MENLMWIGVAAAVVVALVLLRKIVRFGAGNPPEKPKPGTGGTATRPTVPVVFHADLSDGHPGEEYWLQACGKRHSLVAHDNDSRAAARAAEPHLEAVPDHELTHHTPEPVHMPADQVIRVHLKHTLKGFPDAKADHGVGHVGIHIPPPVKPVATVDFGGVDAGPPPPPPPPPPVLNYVSTAKALIFHHPDLITKDPTLAAIIHGYMNDNNVISSQFETLGQQMRQLGQPTETSGWARLVPYKPPANTAPDSERHSGTGEYGPGGQTLPLPDGTKSYYFHDPVQDIIDKAGPVATAMMIATKNDNALKGKKWVQQTGVAVQSGDQQAQSLATIETSGATDGVGGSAELEASAQPGSGDDWAASLSNTGIVHGLKASIKVVDAGKKQVEITLENSFIRYLGAFISFNSAVGPNPMSVPTWAPDNNPLEVELMADVFPTVQTPQVRYLGHISAMNNVFAIPTGPAGELVVTVTFPENAVSATIYGAGLGTGSIVAGTPIVGGVLTGVLNLGVPAFMLAFAVAAQSYKPLYDIVQDLMKNRKFLIALIAGATAFFGTEFGTSAAHKKMNWSALTTLSKLLFDQAFMKLLLWVEAETAGEEAAEEIPFAGWLLIAINIATGVAQMAETIVEVATSPFDIENTITESITTSVTVKPDPRLKVFPAGSDRSYAVKMLYKDQTRETRSMEAAVSDGSTAVTLPASFANNTLGGVVKFEADFYVEDWLAAKATTGWLDNDDATVASVSLVLVERPVPLSSSSVYTHKQLLTYQSDAYTWQPTTTAPTATIASRGGASTGNVISNWLGISLSQKHAMIGLSWTAAGLGIKSCVDQQTGQLSTFQNINIPGMPMAAVKFPSCAFAGPTELIYDPYPPKFLMGNDGQWKLDSNGNPIPDPSDVALGDYYIDPRKAAKPLTADGGYHLRKVVLDNTTPFDTSDDLPSWGRFAFFPDSFVLHPSGHVIAVNSTNGKIQIATLPKAATTDADAVVARSYAGNALQKDRPGLLFSPLAVSCSYDGTVFVLEDVKAVGPGIGIWARVQAFDLYGNPVNRFFVDQANSSPFLDLSLSADYTYLDITAVGNQKMTYLYVLYYTGDGSVPADYHMSIYQVGATTAAKELVTTDEVAAARVAVDMWHSMYTLNFAMVTDGHGNIAGPPAEPGTKGRTVPSISQWLPPVPQNI